MEKKTKKFQKGEYMEAVKTSHEWGTNVPEHPLVESNWRNQPSLSRDEFMDKLAQRLEKNYGLSGEIC